MHQSSFLIAAANSNSGKTTVTMGLLRALTNRGIRVKPFKCGPDYIDTMFHEMASGNESVNLDTFMASEDHVKALYADYGRHKDCCVVEGVMGLFDGYDKLHGSSAEIAMLLDIPVILVVNAKSVAYSVAPLIYGFKHFDKRVRIAGVIFNMVASENHYSFLRSACEDAGVECLGYIPRNERLVIPGRHLGLTITAAKETEELIALAAQEAEAHIDIDRLLELTKITDSALALGPDAQPDELPFDLDFCRRTPPRRTIAIAQDEAFNFTYRANIDVLRRKYRVIPFSPLRDSAIPQCDSLYLPGGYPELFTDELAENVSMRRSIKAYAERGGEIFAECGGFMYLCKDIDGREMCGVFPFRATMEGARLHLGYRTDADGKRGHEFHYSHICEETLTDGITVERTQKTAKGKPVDTAVYHYRNVTAGYTHWYWAELEIIY